MGSDVQRDGMFLELFSEGSGVCAEAFYNDGTKNFSLSLFKKSLPMDAVA